MMMPQTEATEENSIFNEDFINSEEAEELEKKYVNQVYEKICDHFCSTRYKAWPKVAEFLQSITPGSLIFDIGCGYGKYMNNSKGCYEIGCDASCNLAKLCSEKSEVLIADCLKLPFRDDCADVVICIAVIHHMSTKERRKKAIQEILRVLHPKGQCLVYVWSLEQEGPNGSSAYLKKSKAPVLILESEVAEITLSNSRTFQMPVRVYRTKCNSKDILVPFKSGDKVEHRFYHLFQEKELEDLIKDCGSNILKSYYDDGNWCAVFEK